MVLISRQYNLIITDAAQNDIDGYIDTIIYTYDAPITAKKHYDGLYDELRRIQKAPLINAIRHNASLLQYGTNVRRANYKKMTIIYTVYGYSIYVHRVIAQSMILD
jgi:plasmid stabilization system protein ParE